MKPCFLGIDTSNYTTSAAVCDADGNIVANLKIPLNVKDGQRGLRQSDALFEHIKNMPVLMEMLDKSLKGYTPLAIGASAAPRDAEDSYMPVFLVGKSAAYAFASGRNISVYEFSHQNGHIMAALYSSGRLELLEKNRFIAFHVSGGTTEALLVSPKKDTFSVELAGNTSDINGGQAIDRVGVAMGLSFPCGKQMEALAREFDGTVYNHSVCVKDGVCSLSGVENLALKLYSETNDKRAVSAFVFAYIEKTLSKMCSDILHKYGQMPVVFAGGVMSNKLMRVSLQKQFDAYFAEPEFSADNASGTALLCRRTYKQQNGEYGE